MATVFCCATCGAVLTAAVRPLEDPAEESLVDRKPRLPRGRYLIEDEYGPPGWYVVNLEDAVRTRYHPGASRRSGCCGISGTDGKTTLCENGHEVGTEHSDCWQAHALLLDPAVVTLTPVE